MKRYYAHYTYIYPDILLKNIVVEMDSTNHIINYYPLEKELANTEFHSGVQVFVPSNLMDRIKMEDIYNLEPRLMDLSDMDYLIRSFLV